jgi:putative copper export protein
MGDALPFALFVDRIGLNVAALLSIGFALHTAAGVVERDTFKRKRRRWLTVSAVAGVFVFVGLRFLILNAQMGDGTVLFDPELFPLAWAALGPSSMALGAGAVVGAAGLLTGSRLLAAIGAVVLAIGFGLTGHTQGLTEPGLAPIVVAVHVLIAGFWIVAPIALYPAAGLGDNVLLMRLKRFSAIAVVAIPLLILLGAWLAWVLAGGFEPLIGSAYGQLLLLKLAVGVTAMGMGALNKQIVTARIEAEPAKGRRWLRRTLAVETILFAAAILAVSAATTIAGPGE